MTKRHPPYKVPGTSQAPDVRIHYNSDVPETVGALALAQDKDIHIQKGQRRHLPHEAGHIVQQRLGLVKPTTSINGLDANDDPALESHASRLGLAASRSSPAMDSSFESPRGISSEMSSGASILQRQVDQFSEKTDVYKPPVQDLESELDYSYFIEPEVNVRSEIEKLNDPRKGNASNTHLAADDARVTE